MKVLQKVLTIIGITIGYYLFGKLGFLISIDPGNISPLWLPAGIGIIAFWYLGWASAIPIYLGSFALNFQFYLDNQTILDIQKAFVTTSIIAIGVILQSYLGVLVFKKVLPDENRALSWKQVVLMMFILSPIIGTINATWGIGTLITLNILPVYKIYTSWLAWWIGDTSGIIFVFFLSMLFNYQWKFSHNTIHKESTGTRMSVGTISTIAFGILITGVISWLGVIKISGETKHIVGITYWVSNPEYDKAVAAFKGALSQKGYVEGKNIEYIVKQPNGNKEEQKNNIQKFVEMGVDLIFTLTTPGTLIAKEITQKIPIVFSIVTFPVENKLIASEKNSGNNLVGSRNYIPVEAQINTFLKFAPNFKNMGFVHRKGEPNSTNLYNLVKNYNAKLGLNTFEIATEKKEDLEKELEENGIKADALYLACDTMVQGGGEDIIVKYARKRNIPDFSCNKSGVPKGSLVGLVTDYAEIGEASGNLAVEILNGKLPSQLETYLPKKFDLILNISTARRLGIPISEKTINEAAEVYRDLVK